MKSISGLKVVWKAITGFLNPWGSVVGNIAGYGLELLNNALAALDPAKRDKVQAVLNLSLRVLSLMRAVQWLCPVKWQLSYKETLDAVQAVADALFDLNLTKEEFAKITEAFSSAVAAWNGPDDETCVDCTEE